MQSRTFLWMGLLFVACGPAKVSQPPPMPSNLASATAKPDAGAPVASGKGGFTIDQLLNMHRTYSPSLAPDGKRVAFLSDAPGVAQPFVIDVGATVEEKAWKRLVTESERISFAVYSPDGKWIFFGKDKGGDENVQLYKMPVDGGTPVDLSGKPKVKFTMGPFSADGKRFAFASNERNGQDMDIYVAEVESGKATRILEAQGSCTAHAFSRDGKKLAISKERSSFDQDIMMIDATGATVAKEAPQKVGITVLTTHTGDQRNESPQFTADGKGLIMLSDKGREFLNVAVLDVATQKLSFAIPDEHDVDVLAVSLDGKRAATAVNVDGMHEVRVYDMQNPLKPQKMGAADTHGVVVTTLSFSANGAELVMGASTSTSADEIYRVDVTSGKTTRLTQSDHAGVDESKLVSPTIERTKSFDNLEVPFWIYKPVGLTGRAPAVVNVHGGPEGQAQPYFSAVTQYLIGQGYVVVAPNVRGSTGYGKLYSHLDDVAKREDSVKDLAAVNQWLKAQNFIDPKRVAVMGGSYGGYMTLAAITLYPDDWAAACDIVGIANFKTFLQNTAAYRRALREAEYGSLAKDGPLLDKISPIYKVDKIKTPLFVIHGTNDPRVPVGEADQIVAALKMRQIRVEYMKFDNEGHGLVRRENRIKAYGALVTFFADVLK